MGFSIVFDNGEVGAINTVDVAAMNAGVKDFDYDTVGKRRVEKAVAKGGVLRVPTKCKALFLNISNPTMPDTIEVFQKLKDDLIQMGWESGLRGQGADFVSRTVADEDDTSIQPED